MYLNKASRQLKSYYLCSPSCAKQKGSVFLIIPPPPVIPCKIESIYFIMLQYKIRTVHTDGMVYRRPVQNRISEESGIKVCQMQLTHYTWQLPYIEDAPQTDLYSTTSCRGFSGQNSHSSIPPLQEVFWRAQGYIGEHRSKGYPLWLMMEKYLRSSWCAARFYCWDPFATVPKIAAGCCTNRSSGYQ